MRESKNINRETRLEKRNAILAALAKASGETPTAHAGTDEPDAEGDAYYTLTRDEVEALISGNIDKIENWVSNMDRRHATWLLRWLIKESG